MSEAGPWAEFPASYHQERVRIILDWLRVGESGVVVGMSGAGKSNLLGFLSTRPDAARPYLGDAVADTCIVLLDVNRLPAVTGTAFYRAMLQTLYRRRTCLHGSLQDGLAMLYQAAIDSQDDLILFSALQDMHRVFCYEGGRRVAWLLDRFDGAFGGLDVQFLNSLRALRDAFKGQLCYVVATRHPVPQLRDPGEIDEFYEILMANSCWVGPMVERDAQWVARQMAERWGTTFAEEDVARIIYLTGRLPAFLKVAFTMLANGELSGSEGTASWKEQLLQRPEIQRQCQGLWDDLTGTQQAALFQVMGSSKASSIEPASLEFFLNLGLVEHAGDRLRLFSPLFETYACALKGSAGGRIRLHPETRAVWRGDVPLPVALTPKEDLLLSYFLKRTDRLCTKDALIRAVWPDEVPLEGVRDDRLAQLVRRLREKIEFDAAEPAYILTVHGQGYRFVQPDE